MFSELLIVIALIIHGVSFVHRSKYVTLKVWKSSLLPGGLLEPNIIHYHFIWSQLNEQIIGLLNCKEKENDKIYLSNTTLTGKTNVEIVDNADIWTVLIFLYPRHSIWKSNSLSDCHQYKQLPVDVIGYFWSTVMQIETV